MFEMQVKLKGFLKSTILANLFEIYAKEIYQFLQMHSLLAEHRLTKEIHSLISFCSNTDKLFHLIHYINLFDIPC